MAVIHQDQNVETGVVVTRPTINFQHFATPHGALLLVQFVLGIILFVIGAPIYMDIIAWLAWIITHLLIWVYLFSVNERFTSNPPLKVMEFYFNAGASLLYALSTLICLFTFSWISGIFGLVNACAYGASAFFLFQDWSAHRAAGGGAGGPGLPK